MPLAPSIHSVLSQSSVQVGLRMEVAKDDGAWLDLTDRIAHDRLVSVSGLGGRAERGLGGFDVTLSNLTADNSDGWWDAPPPTGVSSWKRRMVRISVLTHAGTTILGHWLIDGLRTLTTPPNAVLTLVGLSRRLLDRDADRCRQGESWYTNRPIGWLVRELLAQEYPRATVEAWAAGGEIANRTQIPLSTAGDRALSAYGRPPEFDGTVWREENLTPRGNAMLTVTGTGGAEDNKVYVGVDDQLWRWDPTTDVWVFIGRMPAAHAAKRIRHLYLNRVAGHALIVGVAWEDDTPSSSTDAAAHKSGAKNGDVIFFWVSVGAPPQGGVLPTYVGGPASIFTGHFFVRAGGYGSFVQATTGIVYNITGIGGRGEQVPPNTDLGWGANLPIPSGHWAREKRAIQNFARAPNGALNTRDGTLVLPGAGGPNHAAQPTGYPGVSWYRTGIANDLRPLDYRFSCGQPGGAFAMQNLGDTLLFTVIRWDAASGTYKFRLWKLDTWIETFTDTGVDLLASTGQPVFMVYRPDDTRVAICGAEWKETAWSGSTAPNNEVRGVIDEYTAGVTPAPAETLFFSAVVPGTTYAWLPFEFCYALSSGTHRFGWATFLNANGIGTSKQWVTCPFDRSLGSIVNNWQLGGAYRYSVGRPRGLVYVAGHGKVYWHEAGSNILLSGLHNSGSTLPVVLDAGFPPVPDDPNLAAGLVYVPGPDLVLGISGPGDGAQNDPETMGAPLTGKYFLWQYGAYLTDRVAIGDFSEMKVWESLEELAAVGDFVFGHDPQSGGFYFKPRPASTIPVGTIHAQALLENEVPVRNIERDWGFADTFTVAEITPSIAILKDPEGTARLLARPPDLNRETWNGDIFPVALNARRQTVYLRCARGSNIGRPDEGAIAKAADGGGMVDYAPSGIQKIHRLRFSWLRYTSVIETQVLVALSATDDTIRIPISHAKDLRGPSVAGADAYAQTDVVRIADDVERTIRTITEDPVAGVAIVQLSSAVGKAFLVATRVIIRTRGNNRWSDHPDGVTWLNSTIAAGTPGAIETWSLFSTRDLALGLVLRIEPAPGTTGRDVEEVRIKRVLSDTQVEVYRGLGGTTAAHGINDRVKAYFAPIQNATWPAGAQWLIGGSGVALRVQVPDSGEMPFMEGDTIDVVAPGLVLEAQEHAKQVSYNQAAIDRAGGSRIPWEPARASRFMGYRQAAECSRRIVRDFGPSKFLARIEGPLALLPAPWQTWLLIDPRRFPRAGTGLNPNGNAPPIAPDTTDGIGMVVREFTFDAAADSLSLGLRAVNPHPW